MRVCIRGGVLPLKNEMWRPCFNPEGKKEESTETLKQLTNTYTYNGENIYEGAFFGCVCSSHY